MVEVETRRLVEKRKRGFFGWIFLIIFWGWNALMAWALVMGAGAANCAQYATRAEQDGCNAGAGIGIMMVLFMWAVGSVVFGMLAYFTRGRREMVEYVTRSDQGASRGAGE